MIIVDTFMFRTPCEVRSTYVGSDVTSCLFRITDVKLFDFNCRLVARR